MRQYGEKSCGKYTSMDILCIWTVAVSTFVTISAMIQFMTIPASRDDHSKHRYTMLAVGISSCILGLTISYSGSGEAAQYGRRRPFDLVIHTVTVVSVLILLICTILIFFQTATPNWPDVNQLVECRRTAVGGGRGNSIDRINSNMMNVNCEKLTRLTAGTDAWALCDHIFEMNNVPVQIVRPKSGPHTEFIFIDKNKFCITSRRFYFNILTGLLGLIAVLSTSVFQGIIFKTIRKESESEESNEGSQAPIIGSSAKYSVVEG